MPKEFDYAVRRPAVAKLAAKLHADGMPLAAAAATAKQARTKAQPARSAGGPLFIHGPQGCGKTRNQAALCKFFGKRKAVDYDHTQRTYASNLIVFSNEPLPGSMPFRTAMSRAGLKV